MGLDSPRARARCRSTARKPIEPKNGPSPPRTAIVTASQNGMRRIRAARMQISDMAIHITPWAMPSTNVSGSGLLRAKAQISSAANTSEWVNEAASRRRNVMASLAFTHSFACKHRAHPAQRLVAFGRPALDVARPPGELFMLWVRDHARPLLEPRHANQHDDSAGEADQRLCGQAARGDRPLLLQFAHHRVDGVLTHLNRASGAEGPAACP